MGEMDSSVLSINKKKNKKARVDTKLALRKERYKEGKILEELVISNATYDESSDDEKDLILQRCRRHRQEENNEESSSQLDTTTAVRCDTLSNSEIIQEGNNNNNEVVKEVEERKKDELIPAASNNDTVLLNATKVLSLKQRQLEISNKLKKSQPEKYDEGKIREKESNVTSICNILQISKNIVSQNQIVTNTQNNSKEINVTPKITTKLKNNIDSSQSLEKGNVPINFLAQCQVAIIHDKGEEKVTTTQEEEENIKKNHNTKSNQCAIEKNDNIAKLTSSNQCWPCGVPLRPMGGWPKVEDKTYSPAEEQISLPSLYMTHVHPSIGVACCLTCAEESGKLLSNEDACAGCGQPVDCGSSGGYDGGGYNGDWNGGSSFGDDTNVKMLETDTIFLLCDSCPRSFCFNCVAAANGVINTMSLISEGNDMPWPCLICSPPSLLLRLRKKFIETVAEKENNWKNHLTYQQDRTVEDVASELYTAECAKIECDSIFDSNTRLNELNVEIKDEILQMSSSVVGITAPVDNELITWKNQWLRHERRLDDTISSLQDELRLKHGVVNDSALYRDMGLITKEGEKEPEWKTKADKEVNPDNWQAKVTTDPSVYLIETPEDVEELDEISDDYNTSDDKGNPSSLTLGKKDDQGNKSPWRKLNYSPHVSEIECAIKCDNTMIEEKQIKIKRVKETDDVAEEKLQQKILVQQPHKWHLQENIRRYSYTSDKDDEDVPSKENSSPIDRKKKKRRIRLQSFSYSPPPSPCTPNKPALENGENINDINLFKVSNSLTSVLKSHQMEGLKFFWQNTFCDLYSLFEHDNTTTNIPVKVGGCILAHQMGLGKSLTTITLIHTLLKHCHPSSLTPPNGEKRVNRPIRTILLVAPVNTLHNWEEEFRKWTPNSVEPQNLASVTTGARGAVLTKWKRNGGVLLVSAGLFVSVVKKDGGKAYFQDPGPDLICIDEAHCK